MLTSIIIRTFNEQKHLGELLDAIANQKCPSTDLEVIVVDSGSTDQTLEIASQHRCKITHISKDTFTYGRSLNIGCEFADGDYLVFISGHCIPSTRNWVEELIKPIVEQKADYTYGRQLGKNTTKFSEDQHFEKSFPDYSKIPQEGYFCNNANAAISRETWKRFLFNEDLTGLEDMYLAKELVNAGLKIAYTAGAAVFHIHDETWSQIRTRYEREAYALHQIMPQLHFTLGDFFRYFISSLMADSAAAVRTKRFFKKLPEIFMFRLVQYWGTYRGNHEVRQLSAEMKMRYFYPKDIERDIYESKDSSLAAHESKQ